MFRTFHTKTFLLLSLCFLIPNAHAGLWLEPYLGAAIGSGDSQMQLANGSTNNWDVDYLAPTAGARLGWMFMGGLYLGVDYSYQHEHEMEQTIGTGSFTFNSANYTNYTFDAKKIHYGAILGFSFPAFLRIWGTYYVRSKMIVQGTPTPAIVAGKDEWGGDGYGVGIGLSNIFPLVSLNFEYRKIEYDPGRGQGGTNSFTSTFDTTDILISLSLPIGL